MTGALKQEVIELYNDGNKTPREIARAYFYRHGVFPNIGSVKTYKNEYLAERKAKFTKIAIRIIAAILIIASSIGAYLSSVAIDKNMSQMYPGTSAVSLYTR